MTNHNLVTDDLISLAFDFQHVAIFHREPLKISIAGVGEIWSGNGLGGFSHTIFERGESCTMCGLCCRRCRRRVWYWHADDLHPGNVTPVDVVVNGVTIPMVYHASKDRFLNCDYNDTNGQCRLHEVPDSDLGFSDYRPVHCDFDPQSNIYPVRLLRGTRMLWSRRLPSRNWLWPQCPIDLANVKLTAKDIENDRRRWDVIADHYSTLPGSYMNDGMEFLGDNWMHYEANPATYQAHNILLEDLLRDA